MQVVIVIVILLLLAAVGAPTIAQAFFVTGSQYYEACWELHTKTEHFVTYAGSSVDVRVEEPKPVWAQCEVIAQRAFFNAGMMFSGNVETSEGDRLRAACPAHRTVFVGVSDLGISTITSPRLPAYVTKCSIFVRSSQHAS